jgi:hypothetical protein
MEQTTARLRKTFQYPTDDDDDSLPEALDEEGMFPYLHPDPLLYYPSLGIRTDASQLEQESLIRSLSLENKTRNALYAKLLLSLPILSTIPFIPALFTPQIAFLSLLSITSLLSTAYLLYILPPGCTAIPLLDALNTNTNTDPKTKAGASRIADPLVLRTVEHGPIRSYLPYLNLVLSAVLALLGQVFIGREMIWWGFAWLPGGVYAVVLLAKVVMGSVNPEAELGALRYEFKGA